MTRNVRRVQLAPAYILHHQPYRDTSRILEVITRDHGRISLFARGVRGPKARLASVLQPFQLLLLSWSGRGEAAQLTGAEVAAQDGGFSDRPAASAHPQVLSNQRSPSGPPGALPPACLMGAFYLSELLLKLTTRHDPVPALFEDYHASLRELRNGRPLEPVLRIFEKRLLDAVGYGLDLASEAQGGRPIEPAGYYHFRPAQGFIPTEAQAAGALSGRSLISLGTERLETERDLEDSRRLLQAALAQCLEGRALQTREVARAVIRREKNRIHPERNS